MKNKNMTVREKGWLEFSFSYNEKGELHREDGPALIIKDDFFKTEYYYLSGVLFREKGAAVIVTHKNNKEIKQLSFHQKNELSKEKEPLTKEIILFWVNAATKPLKPFINDRLLNSDIHSTADSPALVLYNSTRGEPAYKVEKYYKNNLLHREKGAAAIYFKNKKDLLPFKEEWFIEGKILYQNKNNYHE